MTLTCLQNLLKKFTEAGFKAEVKQLAHFEDDYGLEPVEGEDELDDEDEDEDDDEDDEDDDEDSDEE